LFLFLFNFTFIKEKIKEFYQWQKIENFFSFSQKIKKNNSFRRVEKEDSLEISKFDLFLPLSFAHDEQEAQRKLSEGGVIYLPESTFPVEKGRLVILGHSAPDFWISRNYESAFSKISQLKKGDDIILNFNQVEYLFSVQEKYFLEKGEKLPEKNKEKGEIVLISCWPPGQDQRRIALLATLE
ncbi:MAG: sortase, partial [Minisyncoccales bacterium]